MAQDLPSASSSDNGIANAIHMVGLPDVKPGIKGVLKMTPEALEFTTAEVHALIAYNRITSVSMGEERTTGWGTTGKVVRKIPIYGVGSMAGLASQKKVDLLTIEFRDPHAAYHGAVFMLPTKTAAELQQKISLLLKSSTPFPAPSCTDGPKTENSIRVVPIGVDGTPLPDEYRVMMYEHLFSVLKVSNPNQTYFREGDIAAGAGCTTLTLHIAVIGFNKGNQTLRTSTGPLGHFVGTTSVTFNVKLDDANGKTLLNNKVKKSIRGDSDSLSVTKDIAKNLSKRINKAMEKSNAETKS